MLKLGRTAVMGLVGLGSLLIVVGCGPKTFDHVTRTISIHSAPEEATVYLDGEKLATTTPVDIPFTHYGTREITLEKNGFKTMTTMEKISAPWYEWPVIDFFTEVVIPVRLRDEHRFNYTLEAQTGKVDPDKLLERARSLRKEASSP